MMVANKFSAKKLLGKKILSRNLLFFKSRDY